MSARCQARHPDNNKRCTRDAHPDDVHVAFSGAKQRGNRKVEVWGVKPQEADVEPEVGDDD